ncbi:MAG: Ada metal-binding domain-containing protein [Planctomycetota bacterium]
MLRRGQWAIVLVVAACVAAQIGCAAKQVVGNKDSKIFHACECKCIEQMKDENKVAFGSEDTALKEGYRPCKTCFGKGDDDPALKKEAAPAKPDEKKGN